MRAITVASRHTKHTTACTKRTTGIVVDSYRWSVQGYYVQVRVAVLLVPGSLGL